jgi:hypothetical protein
MTTVRYLAEDLISIYEVSVDSLTGQVRGAPRPYFSDPRIVVPAGLAHVPLSNDGMMYVQGPLEPPQPTSASSRTGSRR